MRIGRREIKPAWGWTLLLAALTGASPAEPRAAPPGPTIRLTVEVDWAVPPLPDLPTQGRAVARPPGVELALEAGRIVEVVAWPSGPAWESRPDGSWSTGPNPRGHARARFEAPLGAELTVRVAGQAVRMTLASLLDGPQRPATESGVEVGVERLAWDAIEAQLGGEAGDGTAEPGANLPLSVAFNVLTPEPADVNLRCSAELRPIRGGEPIWRQDWREVVATDAPDLARHELLVAARGPEGLYVLEIKTAWEPLSDPAGSRLGRWVRRRRNPVLTTSATRRLTLAIVGPRPMASPPPARGEVGAEVDSIDLARAWGHRTWASGRGPLASPGRSTWPVPEAARFDLPLRDRLRVWIKGNGAEPSTLAPGDPTGLAWSAVGLRVAHPDRPHRLTVTVAGGHPAALGVAVLAGPTRVVLDACASGPPILDGSPPSTFSWPVWPDTEWPVLVLVNRNTSSPVRVGSIALTELPDLPPAPIPRNPERSIGLHLAGLRSLDRFGGGDGPGDPMAQARNLSSYLAYCGASSVVLPEGLADRAGRRALSGQADEDSSGPDRLDLVLRVLGRRGQSAWVDVAFDGLLPGLPAADSPQAIASGLARVGRKGEPEGAPSYQPIHPRVREAMARKVAGAVGIRKIRPNLLGALVRLGPGSTLPGGPDSGLDDATFARFVATAFEPVPASRVPGQGSTDPGRFEARARYVEAAGRLPWLGWRAREVVATYAGLAEAVRTAATGASLAVSTPALEPGPAGDEARRVDLAGLGPSQGWRGVGLDLAEWPSSEGSPIVLRGVGLSTDDLGHDLATSPELDDQLAARSTRGTLLGVEPIDDDPTGPPRLSARPMAEGVAGDEPLGHALAALDARRVIVAAASVAGQEERIRRFARVFTALPAPPTGPPIPRLPSGVVARATRAGDGTFLALANDTPYPILLEAELIAPPDAPVDDLGRGVRLDPEKGPGRIRLVLDLPPFGVASARVGSPEVRVGSVTPYPGPAVLDGMKAHYDDLWAALNRLNRPLPGDPASSMAAKTGPANPSFEPDAVVLVASTRPAPAVPGWGPAGEAAVDLDRDRPRTGRTSLRLEARSVPAAVVSDPFRPEGRSALSIRAWLRADRPDARVRIRVDGTSAGRPYARQLEVPARLDWAEATVHATQLPEGGLDSARLRFELVGPGRLWVDDVSVQGDALSESERLNGRRDLMAALSAYRDKRYADFARLAGSHWARHVSGGPGPNPSAVAGDRSGLIRTGEASALPPGKRLR